ncbi:DUF4390 domain-containing protein [bacterium]|nr:DUF4390 domain-containing protein [candidate division CSSED10-310 bacterium]
MNKSVPNHHLRKLIGFWVLIFLLSIPCLASQDADPRIKQFRVLRQGDEFLVSAMLTDAFPPEIEDRIQSGVPTTYEFYIFLKKVRWFWDNKILAHALYHHTVTYDTILETYHIIIKREGVDEQILDYKTRDIEDMHKMMSMFNGVLDYPYSDISYDSLYYVSIMASLKTRQVPAPWNLFLSDGFKTRTNRKYFP